MKNKQEIIEFGKLIVSMKNPRARRAFLDSAYAQHKAEMKNWSAVMLQIFTGLLVENGYLSHGVKIAVEVTGGLTVSGMGSCYRGQGAGWTTLSLCEARENQWCMIPLLYVLVPNDTWKPGEKLPASVKPMTYKYKNYIPEALR